MLLFHRVIININKSNNQSRGKITRTHPDYFGNDENVEYQMGAFER